MAARCALGALKIFESPSTPTATWSFNGLLFRWILLWMCVPFEVRSFTRSRDNRGYLKKLGIYWIRAHSLFSKIFNGLLFGWTLWMRWPNLKSVPLYPVLTISIEVLGGGCDLRTLNLGQEAAVGCWGWYHSKERWWVPIRPPGSCNFSSIIKRFRDRLLPLLCSSTPCTFSRCPCTVH